MSSTFRDASDIPSDVMLLIFEQLVGDGATLASVSLTCRTFRALSLPALFKAVDVSCHNNGRLPEKEDFIFPEVYADYDGKFRPDNLITRQRAFLRLMLDRPELATRVQSFTWTFAWLTVEEEEVSDGDIPDITDVERQTWEVFGRLTNVSRLDLASLHWIGGRDPFVRQNPSRLFPAVTDLRLLGWMHRGLIKAIISSIDATRLRSLKLDYVDDEGTMPNGEAISMDLDHLFNRHHLIDETNIIDEELYHRQEAGGLYVFPGPMWLVLRLLSSCSLNRLENLEIRLGIAGRDVRNYYTMYDETAKFIAKVGKTLKSLLIYSGESRRLYTFNEPKPPNICGTGHMQYRQRAPLLVRNTAIFLNRIVLALSKQEYPRLVNIDIRGFRSLEIANDYLSTYAQLEKTWQYIRECPLINVDFTGKSHFDYRLGFTGYECKAVSEDDWRDALARS